MPTVESPQIEALRTALEPVEALRGEQSQFEAWVRESFAAIESLHNDLGDWQRELAIRHQELGEREAGLDDETSAAGGAAEMETILQQLQTSQDEAKQLENEIADQLQTIEDLERQLAEACGELQSLRTRSEELEIALDAAERDRASDEPSAWASELREIRRALERHGDMLVSLGAEPAVAADLAEASEGYDEADDQAARPHRRSAAGRT